MELGDDGRHGEDFRDGRGGVPGGVAGLRGGDDGVAWCMQGEYVAVHRGDVFVVTGVSHGKPGCGCGIECKRAVGEVGGQLLVPCDGLVKGGVGRLESPDVGDVVADARVAGHVRGGQVGDERRVGVAGVNQRRVGQHVPVGDEVRKVRGNGRGTHHRRRCDKQGLRQ